MTQPDGSPPEPWPKIENTTDPGGICRALLSASGRIIRLEARGLPFDEQDVLEAVRGIQRGRAERRGTA